MYKKLTKAYAKNVRLDKPCGLIGVPPDVRMLGSENVLIIAKLSENQFSQIIDCITNKNFSFPQ